MPTKPFIPISSFRVYPTEKWGYFCDEPGSAEEKWQRLRLRARKQKLSRSARARLEWFAWYALHGSNGRATCRHFCIAPKVFYYWRKRFCEADLSKLEDRSCRPKHLRASTLTPQEEMRIVELRREYIRYSKMKLRILYIERYGVPISSWKIQKVIQRFQLYPNAKKAIRTATKRRSARKKKRITEFTAKPYPGFLFCIDTVVRHFGGNKRYILTAIDRHSRLAFARMYASHSSLAAADFLRRLHLLLDGKLFNIQTDNGSEFHLHFEKAMEELKLAHWWSRARTPKDNAVCERFNRTLQEEFISQGNGHVNVATFNVKLVEWLVEYDFHRPHAALGYKRPMEVACPDQKALPIYSSRTFAGQPLHAVVASSPFWQVARKERLLPLLHSLEKVR